MKKYENMLYFKICLKIVQNNFQQFYDTLQQKISMVILYDIYIF